MTNKHAYLIIAHKEDILLRRLIDLLDDERNDIYIHYDKKSGSPSISFYKTKHSKVTLLNDINVNWGAFSLVEVELLLLETAKKQNDYTYYHLLSDQDFPIKSQDYIHSFFEKNQGREFIQFQADDFGFEERVAYYHLLQEKIGRPRVSLLHLLNKGVLLLQKLTRVKRNKDVQFQKGTQWFSITDGLVEYVLSHKGWIHKVFNNTLCSDEIFLQTLVHNSDFRNKIYVLEYDNSQKSMMRLIDWDRGSPYIFSDRDLPEIMASEMLFCRKIDPENSDKLYEAIKSM